MYEKAVKAMAKQRVTLEVLSYHASAPMEEAEQLSVRIENSRIAQYTRLGENSLSALQNVERNDNRLYSFRFSLFFIH